MADVDNRNRNRRSNRAGQPNPKREARAKAAERHVATVSEACATDIERSLAGVCEFDGMPAGFVSAMKAKAQAADAVEEQVAEESEAAEAETAEVASAETEVTAEPAPAEEATETESAPAAEEPAPVLPEVTVLDARGAPIGPADAARNRTRSVALPCGKGPIIGVAGQFILDSTPVPSRSLA